MLGEISYIKLNAQVSPGIIFVRRFCILVSYKVINTYLWWLVSPYYGKFNVFSTRFHSVVYNEIIKTSIFIMRFTFHEGKKPKLFLKHLSRVLY